MHALQLIPHHLRSVTALAALAAVLVTALILLAAAEPTGDGSRAPSAPPVTAPAPASADAGTVFTRSPLEDPLGGLAGPVTAR